MKKIIILLSVVIIASCNLKNKKTKNADGKLKVVSTTTMLTDLLKNIGGDKIELQGLMGPGVDPHLYKATAGDTGKIVEADVIVYSGLHLESKFEDIFNKMSKQGKNIIVASDGLLKTDLLENKNFEGNFDPHMWFDSNNWIKVTNHVATHLAKMDTLNAEFYLANGKKYVAELEQMTKEIEAKVAELAIEKRIMVTAHDAFSYLGRQHDIKVEGLQGLSTTAEVGVKDVQNLVKFIIDNKLKAIFIESSVNEAMINSVLASVKDKGYDLKIGGTLYSDALGALDQPEGTYIGMYKSNVNTVIGALK